MPVLVARENIPTKSSLIIDVFLAVILLVLFGVILAYWMVRRSYREYKQRKQVSKKLLDIEACIPIQDEKTVQTKSKPEFYQVPSIPPIAHIPSRTTHSSRNITTASKFNFFAPIHKHVVHMPKLGDCCSTSQKLKRSFSEGVHEFSRYPSFQVRQVVEAVINAPKQLSSSVVVPSRKSRLASAIEGRAAAEFVIQERYAPASLLQSPSCVKILSQKLLDAKACMTTTEKKIVHTAPGQAVSFTDFDSFAPIHDHLLHIPTAQDYCTTSQRLKKSFSEGIHDYSRYPRFPVSLTVAATTDSAHHSLVAASSQVSSDVVIPERQPSHDVASFGESTSKTRTSINRPVQPSRGSISIPVSDMVGENSSEAVPSSKINVQRGVEDNRRGEQ